MNEQAAGPPIRPTRTVLFADEYDGDVSEVLVTIWPDETVEVATREFPGAGSWGPPLRLVREERS